MAYTTINKSTDHFFTKLWSGTNAGETISGIPFQPDLNWTKQRTGTQDHVLVDAVRGSTKILNSNDNSADDTVSGGVTAFDSDGFSVGSESVTNNRSENYVAWCWKETADAGFDIVSYTGNGTDDTDISHSLSAVPHFFMVKKRSDTSNWNCYHQKSNSSPEDGSLQLDETGAFYDDATQWSDEPPTSSVFTLGNSAQVNANTATFLAYLWSEKQGFSKMGQYTGNGNADGVFTFTGFKPAWIMFKRLATNDWFIVDNKIHNFNKAEAASKMLRPNLNNAEQANNTVDLLSNGFKIRVNSDGVNDNASTYVYAAFAEAPFVNSKGVPTNAR